MKVHVFRVEKATGCREALRGQKRKKGMKRLQSYVHVVAEPGSGAVLQPTLVLCAVQNARKHRVPRTLVLHRGVVQAPAPTAAAGRGGGWVAKQ